MKILSVFLMLCLAALPGRSVQASPGGTEPNGGQWQVKTYEELLKAIRAARAVTQTTIEQAKVREAWETGRLIDEHVLQHKERADYAQQVIPRLAADLGTSDSELYKMLNFYRAYPILSRARELTWSKHEELLSVNDPKARDALAEQAEKENWDRDRLREEVKVVNSGTGPASESGPVFLVAVPGKPGTYRYIKATVGPEAGRNVIDLGFSNYYRTSKDLGFKDGAIMESLPAFPEASSPSDRIKLSKRTAEDLYTYRAWIVNVIDGDTVKAVVDLGFGVRSVQVLRLRGLDCPELATADGKAAKEFVEQMIAAAGTVLRERTVPNVLIRTIKSDKYDRYLADVFLTDKDGKQVYLNNLLLEQGMAVRLNE